MERSDETSPVASRVKAPVRLVLRGMFQVSTTGVAWMYESHSKMYTCTHDGYLQRWTPTREQFHLDEELPIYALSPVSLRILMGSKSNEQTTAEKSGSEGNSENLHPPSSSGGSTPSNSNSTTPREILHMIEDFVEDLAITSIAYSGALKILLVAFQGGRAAVLVGNLEASLSDLKLHWLPCQGATVVAINERKALFSVGFENGDVWLFNAHSGYKLKKQLSLAPWGITKRVTGAAKRLEWTPDGRVLAVGYAGRGLSTWNSSGCRLNCTISELSIMNEEQQMQQIGSAFYTPSLMASARGRTKSRDRTTNRPAAPSSQRTSPTQTRELPPSTPSSTLTPSSNAATTSTHTRETSTASLNSSNLSVGSSSSSSTTPRSPRHSGSRLSTGSTLNAPHAVEGAAGGVNAFSWGEAGYTLLVASANAQHPGSFEQYNLVKASVSANMNMSSSERIMLQGTDRVMLLMNRGRELGELSWNHLPLPSVYAQDSWPLRIASVSPDGAQLAVAGTRGFVIKGLGVAGGSWALFGDRAEEQALRCVALAWFRNYLVTVAWYEPAQTFQIMFFPRGQKLAMSSLAFRGNVPQGKTPTFLDCNDASLVLFTQDAYFQYKISENPASGRNAASIALTLTHQLGVDTPFSATSVLVLPSSVVLTETNNTPSTNPTAPQTTPSAPKISPTSARKDSLNNTSNTAAESKPTQATEVRVSRTMAKMLVLDSSGVLSLTNAERSFNAVLSKGIEQFWMANSEAAAAKGNDDLGNSLWAFGERGLEVWFPFFSQTAQASQQQNYLTRERSLDFDPEVCPIGFLREFGLIVGVCQGPTKAYSTPSPCFSSETKTQPFLHSVLKRMLERGEIRPAVDMAKRYASVSHFQHSLELLLHEALESQHSMDSKRRKQKADSLTAPQPSSTPSLGASNASSLSRSLNEDFDDASSDVSSRRTSIDMNFDSLGQYSPHSSQLHGIGSSTSQAATRNLDRIGTPATLLAPSTTKDAKATSSTGTVAHRRNRSSEKPKVLLRYVFEFLREFGVHMYTTIVVACARKTDPALWQTLFHPRYTAGKPRTLFEHCLSTGQLTVASSYLRVIQLMDGEGEARRAALQCLDLCLKLDNLELLRDLMRFLEPEGASAGTGVQSARNSDNRGESETLLSTSVAGHQWHRLETYLEDVQLRKEVDSHTTGAFNEAQEQFVLEDTLSRYARKLLTSQDLRSLVRFAKITRHELHHWFAKERKRAAIVEDFPATLARIHADFSIPRPTHFPLEYLHFDNWEHSMQDYSAIYFPNSDFLLRAVEEERAEREERNGDYVASATSSGTSSQNDTSNTASNGTYGTGSGFLASHGYDLYDETSWNDSSIVTSFRDLEYLLQAMLAADCAGYALIIATVLFRVPIILGILEKHPIFWRVYKPLLLAERQSQGYGELLVHLLPKAPK